MKTTLFDRFPKKPKKNKIDYKLRLDKVFSEFIRKRDTKNGVFKCISCSQFKPYDKADCGHYFSRRHLSTRFDEDNCHAECSYCNRFKADHMENYRENLIKKIGQQRFDLLKIKAGTTSSMNDFDFQVLIKHYKEKLKNGDT